MTLNGGWVSHFGLLWLLRTGPAAQGRSGVLSEGNRGATRYFMTRELPRSAGCSRPAHCRRPHPEPGPRCPM